MTRPLWPLSPDLCEISSPFGPRPAPVKGASELHNGVDVRCPQGSPLVAPFDGIVSRIWTADGGGLSMLVSAFAGHDGLWRIGVCHLSEACVSEGATIKRGQLIARTGGTPGTYGAGRGSGPHLHMTARGGHRQLLDPMKLEWVDVAGAPVILRLVKKGAA